jgi:hypothetical protein
MLVNRHPDGRPCSRRVTWRHGPHTSSLSPTAVFFDQIFSVTASSLHSILQRLEPAPSASSPRSGRSAPKMGAGGARRALPWMEALPRNGAMAATGRKRPPWTHPSLLLARVLTPSPDPAVRGKSHRRRGTELPRGRSSPRFDSPQVSP